MTTIATDGKVVVSDGRVTSDFIDADDAVKIFVINGEIVGARGDCDLGEAYLDWLRGGRKSKSFPEMPEEWESDFFEALHVSKNGVFYVCGRNLKPIKISAPAAIGSGGTLARAAMLLGKTPLEAVEFAIQHDPHSGGKVHSLSVDDL